MTPEKRTPGRLWNKNFVLWWLGSAQSAFGSSMGEIALSFLVLRITGSAGAMGVNLALSLLPGLLTPLAGTWVDRLPLKPPLILGDLLRGVIMGGVGLWALSGSVPLAVLNGLALALGLIGAFYEPAEGALIPALVPQDQLARANGLIGAAGRTAGLLGLVGGGLLVGRFGSAWPLLVDGATFLVMAAVLPFVNMPGRAASREQNGFWADFGAGVARVRSSRLLMLMPVIGLLVNASIAPMQMLLPKRLLDLGAGAASYGVLVGCVFGGMVLGSALFAVVGARLNVKFAVGAGVALIGGALTAMAFLPPVQVLWLLGAGVGLGSGVTGAGLSTLTQRLVEREFLGRVLSLRDMLGQLGMPLTLLLLAPVADNANFALVFAGAGAGALAASGVWALWGRDEQTARTGEGGEAPQG